MTRRNFTERFPNDPSPDDSGPGATLADDLNRLHTTETGVGYVYFALERLASRYALDNAYVVLDLGALGTQVFRLGGRTTFAARHAVQHSPPGLYCQPDIVSESDARIFFDACSLELTEPGSRQHGMNKVYSAKSLPSKSAARELHDDVAELSDGDEWYISGSTGDRWNLSQSEVAPHVRRWFMRFLVFVDLANLAMALANVHGPIRFFLGLLLEYSCRDGRWSDFSSCRTRHSRLASASRRAFRSS